jgi:hypothetical protein
MSRTTVMDKVRLLFRRQPAPNRRLTTGLPIPFWEEWQRAAGGRRRDS